ncbi:MAG: hypothetical protein AB1742_06730 [bacterium]
MKERANDAGGCVGRSAREGVRRRGGPAALVRSWGRAPCGRAVSGGVPRVVFAAVVLCLALTAAGAVPGHEGEVRLVIPRQPRVSEAAGDTTHTDMLLKKICDVLHRKTGLSYAYRVVWRFPEVYHLDEPSAKYMKFVKSFDPHFMFVLDEDYHKLRSNGLDILPLCTFTIDKKKRYDYCLYAKKTEKVDSIDRLRNLTWGGSYMYWPTRYVLSGNGVDEPLESFFKKLVYYADDEWDYLAKEVVEGRVDIFTGLTQSEYLRRQSDPRFGEIRRVACAPGFVNTLLVTRTTTDPELIATAREILLRAHKDEDFRDFRFFFYAIKGNFVPVTEKDLEPSKALIAKVEKSGWLDEQYRFINKNRAGKIELFSLKSEK